VLADDPGSAVCTLTSFGMVERSRPLGADASRVVSLWKDPTRGSRQIPLEPGAQGVLLTLCGERGTRRTTDGRPPIANATNFFDVATRQIRASTSASPPAHSTAAMPPAPLEVEEVTVLTSVAQAVAEVLAQSPERVEEVLADARAGAPWRAGLGIAEPSPALSHALNAVSEVLQRSASPEATLTLASALGGAREHRADEDGVARLARRILRSTLDQRQYRIGEQRPQ
jgi:hypothetical protein